MTIIIKDIKYQDILKSEDFVWVKARLHRPLRVFGIHFNRSGQCSIVSIYKDNKDDDKVVTLFVRENGLSFIIDHMEVRYE